MKCPNCGADLPAEGSCGFCGYQPPPETKNVVINNYYSAPQNDSQTTIDTQLVSRTSAKSRVSALILCIVLGYIGGHYFYVGRAGMGCLYLFTCGLFGLGWIYDIYRLCTHKAFTDGYGLPLA